MFPANACLVADLFSDVHTVGISTKKVRRECWQLFDTTTNTQESVFSHFSKKKRREHWQLPDTTTAAQESIFVHWSWQKILKWWQMCHHCHLMAPATSLSSISSTVRYIHPPSPRPASTVHRFTISFVRRTMPKNRTIKQTVEQENAIAEEAKAVVLSSVVLIW